MEHYRTIKINNAPANLRTFTVCRVFEHELWFWGTYDEESVALKAAAEINGVIVITQNNTFCRAIIVL